MTDYLRDEMLLWFGPRAADDDRARFASLKADGGSTNLILRNIQTSIDRDGNKDWVLSHTDEAGRTWTARSDTYTGAVLNLFARMCGLAGEIRGFLPEPDEETQQ